MSWSAAVRYWSVRFGVSAATQTTKVRHTTGTRKFIEDTIARLFVQQSASSGSLIYPTILAYSAWPRMQNQSTPPGGSTPMVRWYSPTLADQNLQTLLKWSAGCQGSIFMGECFVGKLLNSRWKCPI